jgi:4-hydroxybenzoyl-CoA reductase subunit beta
MDALPEFEVVRPKTLDALIAARAAHPQSSLLGGGTDLIVNIRRGIVAPKVLIETNGVKDLHAIAADAHRLAIGAAVTLTDLAADTEVVGQDPRRRQVLSCPAPRRGRHRCARQKYARLTLGL